GHRMRTATSAVKSNASGVQTKSGCTGEHYGLDPHRDARPKFHWRSGFGDIPAEIQARPGTRVWVQGPSEQNMAMVERISPDVDVCTSSTLGAATEPIRGIKIAGVQHE